jgi:hypothetical protein
MPKTKQIELQFGAAWLVPTDAKAAWGARLIFPADLLHDRQGFYNWDSDAGRALKHWLNQEGALKKALTAARKMAERYKITSDGREDVVLYEDDKGKFMGTPNASYGYLYVAAWMKEGL